MGETKQRDVSPYFGGLIFECVSCHWEISTPNSDIISDWERLPGQRLLSCQDVSEQAPKEHTHTNTCQKHTNTHTRQKCINTHTQTMLLFTFIIASLPLPQCWAFRGCETMANNYGDYFDTASASVNLLPLIPSRLAWTADHCCRHGQTEAGLWLTIGQQSDCVGA